MHQKFFTARRLPEIFHFGQSGKSEIGLVLITIIHRLTITWVDIIEMNPICPTFV